MVVEKHCRFCLGLLIKGRSMPSAVQSCIPVFSFKSSGIAKKAMFLLVLSVVLLSLPLVAKEKQSKIDSLKKVLVGQKDTTRINTLLVLTKALISPAPDSAIRYGRMLKNEALGNGGQKRICDAYVVLGTCYHHLHQEDSAMYYKRLGIIAGREADYPRGEANAASDLGLYLKERGDLDSALYYILLSAELREDAKDEKALGVSYNNLAMVYYGKGDTVNSIDYYRKAASLFRIHRPEVLPAPLGNLAVLYDEMKMYDSALYYYGIVLHICDSIGDDEGYSRVMMNIGVTYRQQGKYKEAEQLFLDALKIKEEIDDRDGQAIATLNLAQLYRVMNQFELSEKYLVRADSLAQSLEQKELIRDVYQVYAELYSQTGRGELAVEYFDRYRAMSKEILSAEALRLTEEMQERFETEKKEKENLVLREQQRVSEASAAEDERQKKLLLAGVCALMIVLGLSFYAYRTKIKSNQLLESKNEQISKQNSTLRELNKKLIESEEELTALNATKDQLFSIISHDLGNPVNALVNYNTVMQSRREAMTKEELLASLEKVNLTLRPLQEFLENLLQWSVQQKNGVSIRRENFVIGEVLNEVTALYQGSISAKGLTVETVGIPEGAVNTDKNVARLIVRNLLGNAIKFSPSGGKIGIHVSTDTGKLILSVTDNGAGISKEKIEKIQSGGIITSERGTAMETGTGLGLNLVREFLNALGGKLEIKSENGTTVMTATLT